MRIHRSVIEHRACSFYRDWFFSFGEQWFDPEQPEWIARIWALVREGRSRATSDIGEWLLDFAPQPHPEWTKSHKDLYPRSPGAPESEGRYGEIGEGLYIPAAPEGHRGPATLAEWAEVHTWDGARLIRWFAELDAEDVYASEEEDPEPEEEEDLDGIDTDALAAAEDLVSTREEAIKLVRNGFTTCRRRTDYERYVEEYFENRGEKISPVLASHIDYQAVAEELFADMEYATFHDEVWYVFNGE